MYYTNGNYSMGGNFKIKKQAPMDDRSTVAKKIDLQNPNLFDGFTYNGMIVSVVDDGSSNGVYRLEDKSTKTWVKEGSDVDLTNYYKKSETYNKVETGSLVSTKQDNLVSGTNIKTINGESVLGGGDLEITDGGSVQLTGNQTIAGIKTFSSNIVGNITGNSATATKLQTARTINGVTFDGSTNVTIADATAVKLTGNQTIEDVKTFTSSPKVPTPTASNDAVNKKYVDDRTSIEAYKGSYGLEWNETTDTYRRIGAENYTAIQSMMRRCVLNSDGSVNYYLDKNNSNFKENGVTAAVLDGTDGNVMVEVPKTYVRYAYTTTGGSGTDTVHRWEISLEPETEFEAHWAFDRGGVIRDKRYYPAYLGYVTGGKMISRSGVYPTVNQTLVQFRAAAKANSISNPSSGQTANGYWGNIDFALYELITLLAVIEYGTMNIQSALGRGRTALSGGSWVGGELIGVNGLSNEYGNRTANYTYVGASTDANADLSFMSYRGCENFFGNVWRMADGVIFKGTTNNKTMWYSTTPTGYNETGAGYVNSGIVTAAVTGYGRKLANTNKGFIISDVTGGNSNAGTTDYYYTSTTDNTATLVGGDSDDGLTAGPLRLDVSHSAASLSGGTVGCGVSF